MKHPDGGAVCAPDFRSWGHRFESHWKRNTACDCIVLYCTEPFITTNMSSWYCLNNVEWDVKLKIVIVIRRTNHKVLFLIQLHGSVTFKERETTFVTHICHPNTPNPFWKGIYSKRKEFAPRGSKFFPFREDPFRRESKWFWLSCLPWQCMYFP